MNKSNFKKENLLQINRLHVVYTYLEADEEAPQKLHNLYSSIQYELTIATYPSALENL